MSEDVLPLSSALPSDALMHILSFLDAPGLVSAFASGDQKIGSLSERDVLWKDLRRRRWEGKHNTRVFLLDEQRSAKESYRLAELDSRRKSIGRDEFCRLRWMLVYNGVPSRMGLRSFGADGTYMSPYFGQPCPWEIVDNCLLFSGLRLPIERNENNWGWIVGGGSNTVYYSVDVDDN
uniref:F-box domain-containing protein n=1 Tax=Odontella aurita TaxID=265563 RepID=A0A7S4KAY8_9STRA|mmetsp:Transcript_841/g.2415  ORF Transcript_841/g.2415 Transcript_841/m.2415 type:complete len:178 (+) Transcript_841:132-665(+)|eukprot:CAMPEP_0113526042 /NCGR_PEP_ID=MMETSP0015_2-20120614/520_1 /TAXON_ID=2838 /ORGANISM="Odontella" /LENGTH=177 /DNA_ID=CAMNT_0000424321 /DNA_START=70 /DNA_END=603 /DNA_ORIENTATION=+ /assembly_acc=CAM_ASM_000160